jgi:hypothetical protein
MLRAVTVSIDEATIDIRPHTPPGYFWVIIHANAASVELDRRRY